jgi:GPH family glycoside/pentoside/hexuronide:cation symporter
MAIVKTKYFPLLCLIFIAFFAQAGVSGGVLVYYCRDVLGDFGLYSFVSMASALPMIIGLPLAPVLLKKFGKRNMVLVGNIGTIFFYLLRLISPSSPVLFIATALLISLFGVPFQAAIYTLVADLVDYGAYKSGGVRSEGFASMASSVGTKIGAGIGSAILGWVLAWGRYNAATAVQPASALTAMNWLANIIPAIFDVVICIGIYFWDVEKFYPEFRRQATEKSKLGGAT